MVIILKLSLIAISSVIIISLVKQFKPEFTIEVTICASIILLYFIIDGLSTGLLYITEIYGNLSYGKSYFPIIIKVLIISYVTEFAVSLCQDAGEKTIANKLELAGKICIFIASIPVFDSIFDLLNDLM